MRLTTIRWPSPTAGPGSSAGRRAAKRSAPAPAPGSIFPTARSRSRSSTISRAASRPRRSSSSFTAATGSATPRKPSRSSATVRAGTLLISGIFELKPIALCYINDKLRLTSREIEELSPLNSLPRHGKPCFVVAGEAELSELKRQSQLYAEGCKGVGSPTFLKLLPGHNHYAILSEFSDRTGMLTRLLQDLVARCPALVAAGAGSLEGASGRRAARGW